MIGVILAAGMGVRLNPIISKNPIISNIPKSLIQIGEKTLLEYSLDNLSKHGIKKAIIVIGYLGEMIKEKIGDNYNGMEIIYVENKKYETTGTMYSFFKAKELIGDDVILLEADLLYDNSMIDKVLSCNYKNLIVVSKLTNTGDEVLVSSSDKLNVLEIGKKIEKKDIIGEFIGISKLSKEYIEKLFDFVYEKYFNKNILDGYYENYFVDFSKNKGNPINYFLTDNTWTEIDDEKDLEYAKQIFPKLDFNIKNNKPLKKIMLINPSNTMPKDSVRRLASPLGLLYLGAVLKNDGYDVKILDSTCEGYYNTKVKENYIIYGLPDEEVIKKIEEYSPDIVGVSSMFSAHQKNSIHYCNLVKLVNKDIIVVLGGIHPSLAPEESIMNDSVDFVIIGEGEFRFLKLLNTLNKGKKDFDFDGIAYKKNDKIIINPMIKRIENLDEIPLPARDLVDIEKYIKIGVPYAPFSRRERVEQVMVSRGCPYNCIFCSTVNYWGHKFRMRSIDNIMKEIDELVNKYKVEEIQFPDDNMTVDREKIIELFKKLKKYNLAWCTPHGLMPQTLDEEMIKVMAESGAYQLTFAIESGSERVLKDIIHKPVPPKEKVKRLIDKCHKYNIQVHGMFVVGFPGETRKEMLETLNYPFGVGFDSVSFFIVNPVPGSELYDECKKKGYLMKDAKMDFKSAEINIPRDSPDYVMSREELVKLVDDKTREFNEFSKKKHPERWEIKFKQFLKKHGNKADLILGRVT